MRKDEDKLQQLYKIIKNIRAKVILKYGMTQVRIWRQERLYRLENADFNIDLE